MTTSAPQALLKPLTLGDLQLRNRIVMAPLTRTRAANPGHVPNDLMREYYQQRASAGLIISEGTWVSEEGQGWHGAPGIYNEEQGRGWKAITDAVHAKGGLIFAQLWHQGSVSLAEFSADGRQPLAPSAINPGQQVHGINGVVMSAEPRAMTREDIRQTVTDFRQAAQIAKDAGFDGVQIQAGYVYLIQQFLHETTNQRTDEYGGSIENRARLLFEVLDAVLQVWPSQRVGIKTGPMMSEHGALKAVESTLPTVEYVYEKLSAYNLSHLLVMRQMADLSGTPIAHLAGDEAFHHARRHYSGTVIANTGVTREHGSQLLEDGTAEAVAFGRDFIANPDLVERIRQNTALNEQRPEGYYGASEVGYTDYPTLAESEVPA
ncbi:MAG: N-ethylmaleimide reductase [Pseudomonas sp.]|nr:N-ethylmaleimide reductase [Pseudomonas sp.]